MRKQFIFLAAAFACVLFFAVSPLTACAEEMPADVCETVIMETTEYFENGIYAVTTVKQESVLVTRAESDTITGSKEYVMYNQDGHELWRFTVYGTFSVTPGVNAVCTDASCSFSIANNAWENQSASAYPVGNQAVGDAAFIKKLFGITVDTQSCHIVLTCDADGNLS